MANDRPVPIVLLSKQRSGTRVFGQLLNQSADFVDFSEVMTVKKTGKQKSGNYFEFLKDRIREDEDILNPKRRREAVLAYLAHLEGVSGGRSFMIDIKYNQIHHLCDRFAFHDPPRGIHFLSAGRARFIHLVRENVVGSIVSSEIIKRRGQAHIPVKFRGVLPDRMQVHLDPGTLKARIATRREEIDRFRRFLADRECLEIHYEQLFEAEGRFSAEVIDRVCNFIGIERDFSLDAPLRKTGSRDPLDSVSNADEVAEALREIEAL